MGYLYSVAYQFLRKRKSINVDYQLHTNCFVYLNKSFFFFIIQRNVKSSYSLCWYDSSPMILLSIGNLDELVDENALRALFIPFGEVREVTIPLDAGTGERRGFGFVEFDEPDDAAEARDNMNSR